MAVKLLTVTILVLIVAVTVIWICVWLRETSWSKAGYQLFLRSSLAHYPVVQFPSQPVFDHTVDARMQNTTLQNRTVIILMWGAGPWKKARSSCPGYPCLITRDSQFFNISDALVLSAIASDLKNSVKSALELKRPSYQRWVILNKESPVNTRNLRFLNGHINWTISFMADSDVAARSVVVPGTFLDGFEPSKNYLEEKSEMAAILVSNCNPERLKWVKAMQQYIDVEVYGDCGKLNCSRIDKEQCYAKLLKYKFYLSFENSFCKDYITEKFYKNALWNGIVPVIISRVNTSDVTYVPPGSFINALDFPTVKDLTDYMTEVGSSPERYNEYFRWRSNYTVAPRTEEYNTPSLLCKLCKKIHMDPVSVKSYSNLRWWYSPSKNCIKYPKPR